MVDYEKVGIGIGVLAITVVAVYILYYLMKCSKIRFFRNHNHVFQLLLTLLFSIGIIVSIYEAFGYEMAASLLTGVGIALGLALQPMMKKVVAGMVFDTTIKKNSHITVGKFSGTVDSVGVIHTIINTKDGKVCIHNDYFNTNPVVIKDTSSSSQGPDQPEDLLLKYW